MLLKAHKAAYLCQCRNKYYKDATYKNKGALQWIRGASDMLSLSDTVSAPLKILYNEETYLLSSITNSSSQIRQTGQISFNLIGTFTYYFNLT